MSGAAEQASPGSDDGRGLAVTPALPVAPEPVQESKNGVTTLEMPAWASSSAPTKPRRTHKANVLLVKLVHAEGLPEMRSAYVSVVHRSCSGELLQASVWCHVAVRALLCTALPAVRCLRAAIVLT